MTLIDTAEMYGDGASERLVGEAIADRRDEVFLVSKVLPQHATAKRGWSPRARPACAAWAPIGSTSTCCIGVAACRCARRCAASRRLLRDGQIRHWGVSNFFVADLAELVRLPGGDAVAGDQVLYSLEHRTAEYEVLPWCLERGLPVLAYSPLDQGRLCDHPLWRRWPTVTTRPPRRSRSRACSSTST